MDCAASGGHDMVIELLIKAEADVDPTDKSKVLFSHTHIHTHDIQIHACCTYIYTCVHTCMHLHTCMC